MNTILERSHQMGYHTDIRLVFEAIQGRQKNFNWLLTNIECNHDPDPRIRYPYPTYLWLTGDEITQLVYSNEIQFIWGVFSGFERHFDLEDVLPHELPYADGNPHFWISNPQVQHPLATLEIVAWDSTLTLLLSKDDSISKSFRSFFPEARDLNEYNKRFDER